MVKNPPANAGDAREAGSIPGSGRAPGEGYGSPLQYSSLENSMEREAWQIAVKELDTLIHTHSFRNQTKNHLVKIKCFLSKKHCIFYSTINVVH